MKTNFVGRNSIWLENISSTNSFLSDLTAKGMSPEGTVVIASFQQQGRGQRGTTWQSERGKNLTLSILLKPTFIKADEQFALNKAISLGVMDFIAEHIARAENESGKKVKIKWPNDIYIGNKKVAGILIENSVIRDCLIQSVVGIGINVNQEEFPPDIPNATSLKNETGKEIILLTAFEQLAFCIEKRYLQLRSCLKEIDADYLRNLYRFNEWSDYRFMKEKINARISGISVHGKLLLKKRNSGIIECDFKEVEFIL